jgi:hypothetical protein
MAEIVAMEILHLGGPTGTVPQMAKPISRPIGEDWPLDRCHLWAQRLIGQLVQWQFRGVPFKRQKNRLSGRGCWFF